MLRFRILKAVNFYKGLGGLKFYGDCYPELRAIIDGVIDTIKRDEYLNRICFRNSINIVFGNYAAARLEVEYIFLNSKYDDIDPDGLYWFVVESLLISESLSRGMPLNLEVLHRWKSNVDRRVKKWELENPI